MNCGWGWRSKGELRLGEEEGGYVRARAEDRGRAKLLGGIKSGYALRSIPS